MRKKILMFLLSITILALCVGGIIALVSSFEGIIVYWNEIYHSGNHSFWVRIAPTATFLLPIGALIYSAVRATKIGRR